MKRSKLKYGGRKKALFGSEEAAILGAAAINVAGTMAGAAMGAKSTVESAKQQAQATKTAAEKQAEALRLQNETSKQNQEEMIAFNKEQNEENRELQKQIQMNLQMLAGQQNTNDRLEASKIQVRNGGSMRRKLKYGNANTLLRGSYSPTNMPFKVIDGGGVIPIGTTPEGNDLYEIVGNDHNHYHRTLGGKRKTGVGIKFANGGVIEGEGNQNTNQGELMLVTPNDAKFISKHTIAGFNPANAVMNGMNPNEAFARQETIKSIKGITDDGKRKKLLGGNSVISNDSNPIDFSNDTISPTIGGIEYIINQNSNIDSNNMNYGSRNSLKCGGRIKKNSGGWYNLASSGLTGLGNFGGALLGNYANNKAMGYISKANNQAADILANAYSQMKGVDMSLIKKEDYAPSHTMAAVRAPIINTSTQRAAAERSLQRRLTNIDRNSLSGAAAQNRIATAESDYIDNINDVENKANLQKETIKQSNMETINRVANENANRDVQSNRDYSNAYLNLLQYNNNIENEKISGIAQARANALTQNAQIAGSTQQANAQGWASALTNTTTDVANTLGTIAKYKQDRANVLLGVDNQRKYEAAMANGDKSEAKALIEQWKNGTPEQQEWAWNLGEKFGYNKPNMKRLSIKKNKS